MSLSSLLRLSPLGALYLVFAVVRSRVELQWDEGRYLQFASNLLQGGYAGEETLFLWNGPGYPLVLAVIVGLQLPLVVAKAVNAILLFFAIAYFHATLRLYLAPARALFFGYVTGIYLLLHGSLIEFLMSEPLSVFLVCASTFHFIQFMQASRFSWMHFGATAMALGYLALTKVFFGWVILACLLLALVPAVLRCPRAMRISVVTLAALIFCLPYLTYTHKLTGKLFYWGNSGGVLLYCMSLTEDYLLGDWLNFDAVRAHPEFFQKQHAIFVGLAELNYVERDAWFKNAALENIRERPLKYFRNWRANINRMVFGYPQSRYPGADPALTTGNRSLIYACVFFLWAVCAIPFSLRWKKVPAEIQATGVFLLIALAGTSLLSAIPRQIFPLIPLLLLTSIYALEKLIEVEWVSDPVSDFDVDVAAHSGSGRRGRERF